MSKELNLTWWEKANKDYETDPTLYYTGVCHFQAKALAELEQQLMGAFNPEYARALENAIETIRTLKAPN